MNIKAIRCVAIYSLCMAASTACTVCRGDVIYVSASSTGFFFNDSVVENYGFYVGYSASAGGLAARNYFVFNTPDLPGDVATAQLIVPNGTAGFFSDDLFEVFATFDVTTPIADLLARNSFQDNFDVFNDLGSGLAFGEATVDESANGAAVVVNLSPDAIASLNASSLEFAIGGSIASADPPNTGSSQGDQYLFGFSQVESVPSDVLLRLVTVPEPSCAILLSCFMGGVVCFNRTRPS